MTDTTPNPQSNGHAPQITLAVVVERIKHVQVGVDRLHLKHAEADKDRTAVGQRMAQLDTFLRQHVDRQAEINTRTHARLDRHETAIVGLQSDQRMTTAAMPDKPVTAGDIDRRFADVDKRQSAIEGDISQLKTHVTRIVTIVGLVTMGAGWVVPFGLRLLGEALRG